MPERGISKKLCRKCLLQDMPKEEYFKNLYEYIEHLDKEIKVEQSEYERRLTICRGCENLLNGMCRICGCFVELRAVIEKNYCPHTEKYW